jgi:hypothetical protein
MRFSREQRAARAIVIAVVSRQLRDSWSPEEVGPIPDLLAQLVSRIEQQDERYSGRRGRITPARRGRGDRQMKSPTKQKRLNELTPEERKVLEAAAASCPIEELNIDLVLDQARALGELQ